jgi:hypothetical protein
VFGVSPNIPQRNICPKNARFLQSSYQPVAVGNLPTALSLHNSALPLSIKTPFLPNEPIIFLPHFWIQSALEQSLAQTTPPKVTRQNEPIFAVPVVSNSGLAGTLALPVIPLIRLYLSRYSPGDDGFCKTPILQKRTHYFLPHF